MFWACQRPPSLTCGTGLYDMGIGSTRGTRWKLIPGKQNDGQEERERVKEHVSEGKDTSFLVFWSFGTHDNYRELGGVAVATYMWKENNGNKKIYTCCCMAETITILYLPSN